MKNSLHAQDVYPNPRVGCKKVVLSIFEDWLVGSSAMVGGNSVSKDGRSTPSEKESCTISASTYLVPRSILTPQAGTKDQITPIRIRERKVDRGIFTKQCTSSCGPSWSREQRVWHAQTPHGHPRWSLPNTPSTCMRQSFCGFPHPGLIVSLYSWWLRHCHVFLPSKALDAEGAVLPAREWLAFGWSCVAPQSSSGRSANPSCSQQGWLGVRCRNEELQRSTVEARVSDALSSGLVGGIWGYGTFSWTLSRESGESTAKQMRMTCESGYESGLRRS